MFLPDYDDGEPHYIALLPLSIMGVGYSIYASAIWGSIPYVVPTRTMGSAFGLTTAVQNMGLVIAPLGVSFLEDGTKSDTNLGFFWPLALLASFSFCGFCVNLWLYFDDLKNRNRNLQEVQRIEINDKDGSLVGSTVSANIRLSYTSRT